MSLRDQIDQFMADHDPSAELSSAIDDLFDSGGFDGFDPGTIVDALFHYADTSPIEVADSLSGFLTEHSDVPIDEFDPGDLVEAVTGLDAGSFAAGAFGALQLNDDSDDAFDDDSETTDQDGESPDDLDSLDDSPDLDDGGVADDFDQTDEHDFSDDADFTEAPSAETDELDFDDPADLDFDF